MAEKTKDKKLTIQTGEVLAAPGDGAIRHYTLGDGAKGFSFALFYPPTGAAELNGDGITIIPYKQTTSGKWASMDKYEGYQPGELLHCEDVEAGASIFIRISAGVETDGALHIELGDL